MPITIKPRQPPAVYDEVTRRVALLALGDLMLSRPELSRAEAEVLIASDRPQNALHEILLKRLRSGAGTIV